MSWLKLMIRKKELEVITPSSNTELPNPLNSFNSPLGSLNNKSKETIQQQNGKQNYFVLVSTSK